MKLAALLLVVGSLAGAAAGAPRAPSESATEALYAFTPGRPQLRALTRVAPGTLKPVGRTVHLAAFASAWSFSGDRTRLVLANERPALRLVDLRRMEREGDVLLPALAVHTAWLGRSRIVAVTSRDGRLGAVAVDANSRRVVATRRLGRGTVVRMARARSTLALLVAPGGSVGPMRLVTLTAALTVRSVSLPATRGGFGGSAASGQPGTFRHRLPGLALDRSGERVFVVGDGEPVAEVDLRSLTARYHPRRTLSASSKSLEGPTIEARWLGGGLLAVAGWRSAGFDASTRESLREPLGLTVIDTRNWSERTIDPEAGTFKAVGATLVTYDDGRGVLGYGFAGAERFRLFEGEKAFVVLALGGRLYVATERTSVGSLMLVDARDGRVVGRHSGHIPRLLTGP